MPHFHGRIERHRLPGDVPLLLLPQPGPGPAVLLLPPFGAAKEALLWEAAAWHDQGFTVAVLELAGHGERARADLPVALRRDFHATYFDLIFQTALECPRAVDFLLAQGASGVAAVGQGLGGAAALVAAGLEARFAAVVAIGAVADYEGFMAESLLATFVTGRAAEAYMDPEARRRLRAHDPFMHPERYAPTPLLLLHGEEDAHHPVGGIVRFWERLIAPYEAQAGTLVLRTEPEVGHEGHPDWFELAVAWARRAGEAERAVPRPEAPRGVARPIKLPLLKSAKQVF